MQKDLSNPENFTDVAVRVSRISIWGNTLLALLKLLAGILAHSGAMVSDAVHSASDVFSSIVVIIGVRLSARESDDTHPYGHERIECAAAVILSVILCFTGLLIGQSAFEKLKSPQMLRIPGQAAILAAVFSILCKEAMFRYTAFYGKRINSGALMADAWHHRSDALSSVGSLVGIAGARMGYAWLDPAASLVICVFIEKAAYDIFSDALRKMVDHSCSEDMQTSIRSLAEEEKEVKGIKRLLTREFGNRIYVDLEVYADGDLTLMESHSIAEKIHHRIEETYPQIKHISVRMRPLPKKAA